MDYYGGKFEFDVEATLCGDFELCACFREILPATGN